MRPDSIRDAGLRELGVHRRLREVAFSGNGHPRPYGERQRLLEEYKVELKKTKKSLARNLHPDVNGDLPEEERKAKSDEFTRAVRAIDFVLELEVKPPPPPQPMMRQGFVIIIGGNPWGGISFGGGGTSTQTTSTTAGFWSDIVR